MPAKRVCVRACVCVFSVRASDIGINAPAEASRLQRLCPRPRVNIHPETQTAHNATKKRSVVQRKCFVFVHRTLWVLGDDILIYLSFLEEEREARFIA